MKRNDEEPIKPKSESPTKEKMNTTTDELVKIPRYAVEAADAELKTLRAKAAHAQRLAEALKAWEYAGNEGGISMVDWFEVARKKTREALAQWEAAQ